MNRDPTPGRPCALRGARLLFLKVFQKIALLSQEFYAAEIEEHIPRTFHLSFVLYKGHIISIGRNTHKTNPTNLRNPRIGRNGENLSYHKGVCSEFSAIIKLKNVTNVPFRKCILVNVRIDRTGKLNNSKPCASCANLIRYFDLKKVYYTNNKGQFIEYR